MSYIARVHQYARQVSYLFEDFLNGPTGSQIASSVSGAGAAVAAATVDTGGHPGVVSLSTGTTSTGSAAIITDTGAVQFGSGVSDATWLVKIPTLSTGLETFTFRVGFIDSASAAATDGAYFEVESSTNANWVSVTANNGSRTLTTTSVAVVADTWYTLRVSVNPAASSVDFYVNGAQMATSHTVNIPSATGRLTGLGAAVVKSVGTTARSIYIDYCSFFQSFTTHR